MPHFKTPGEVYDKQDPPSGGGLSNSHDVFMWITIGAESLLVLLNLLPILVVVLYKNSEERLSIDRLVVALSVTDILSVIIPSPFTAISHVKQHWIGGSLSCDLYQISNVCFQLTSMCLITLMCIDRCFTLHRTLSNSLSVSSSISSNALVPSSSSSFSSTGRRCINRTALQIAMVYIACLCLSCLPLLGFAPPAYSASRATCQSWISATSSEVRAKVFPCIFLSVGFINLMITLCVNVLLLRMLWRLSSVNVFSEGVCKNGNPTGANGAGGGGGVTSYPPVVLGYDVTKKSVRYVTLMTVVVTVVFYIAWMPALILIVLEKLSVYHNPGALFYVLLCTTLTGLLNPIIYAFFSRSYCVGYRQICGRAWELVTGCPVKPKGFTALSTGSGIRSLAERTGSSLSALISLNRSSSQSSKLSTRHHHHHHHRYHHHHHHRNRHCGDGAVHQESSTDSESECSPGDSISYGYTTQLDALSCTEQKPDGPTSTIYCTPSGCSSVVDLELHQKVYGDFNMADTMSGTDRECEPEKAFDNVKLTILDD